MLAAVVDTGDVSVVANEGLLESSFNLCSWRNMHSSSDTCLMAIKNTTASQKRYYQLKVQHVKPTILIKLQLWINVSKTNVNSKYHSFIFSSVYPCQGAYGARQEYSMDGIPVHHSKLTTYTFKSLFTPRGVSAQPINPHVFGWWEETREHRGNQHGHQENMHTGRNLSSELNPKLF